MLNTEEQDLAAKNEYNFDHPDAFDFELLVNVLRKLKKGKSVKVPVYDFTSHCRRKEWVRSRRGLGSPSVRNHSCILIKERFDAAFFS